MRRGGDEKGKVISETQVEIKTKDGVLLFDNQRNIEKSQILAYKTYQILAIEELDIRPEETLSPKLHLLCDDLSFSYYTLEGCVKPCA
jgi:hypothetical protein